MSILELHDRNRPSGTPATPKQVKKKRKKKEFNNSNKEIKGKITKDNVTRKIKKG